MFRIQFCLEVYVLGQKLFYEPEKLEKRDPQFKVSLGGLVLRDFT